MPLIRNASHLFLAAAGLTLAACSAQTEGPQSAGPSGTGGGGGALALFPILDAEAEPDENVVISPVSIDLAFGLLHAGARGETRTQLEQYLPPLADPMGYETDKDDVKVAISNALFLDDRFRFRDSYVSQLRREYEAKAIATDFTDKQGAADTINSWADDATEGLIPEVIPPAAITPDMIAVLANALYFDGLWETKLMSSSQHPFLFGSGREAPFTFVGETFETPYARVKGWKSVRLPYRNDRYAMDILMPSDREIMAAAPPLELIERLKQELDGDETELVRVEIPQFETDFAISLNDTLMSLGVTLPFDEVRVDLSGLAEPGQRPIVVSDVRHVTKLQVYDEGTKAAAVTTISIVLTGGRVLPKDPILFRADRPFIAVLRDLERDAVLFIGRISDPQPFDPEVAE
ncbi:serpin family protein [Qipengyuania sp. 1XM1-15A]|uniref:serpin family protein n=1 Tax=Qipengyuania xiamenensis TaxID=2867237 RepID=UPI001C8674AF|nr:serpin family protein [Qipengyuania xiamenensis]MBX7532576.1 serpin family protein [Qipengyuania xiamenensis]